jgi:ribosomal protein L29
VGMGKPIKNPGRIRELRKAIARILTENRKAAKAVNEGKK